mmetsp:Transcript_1950/g.2987  ORF Transcript_1950/g.2987 Transcript_1950/m.2987 type:complete len:99 (-) Transcript_1950:13-309(-)
MLQQFVRKSCQRKGQPSHPKKMSVITGSCRPLPQPIFLSCCTGSIGSAMQWLNRLSQATVLKEKILKFDMIGQVNFEMTLIEDDVRADVKHAGEVHRC